MEFNQAQELVQRCRHEQSLVAEVKDLAARLRRKLAELNQARAAVLTLQVAMGGRARESWTERFKYSFRTVPALLLSLFVLCVSAVIGTGCKSFTDTLKRPLPPGWVRSLICAICVICGFNARAQVQVAPPFPRPSAVEVGGTNIVLVVPITIGWDWTNAATIPPLVRFTWHTNGGPTNVLLVPPTPTRLDLTLEPAQWFFTARGADGTNFSVALARLTVTRTNVFVVDLTQHGPTPSTVRVYAGEAKGTHGILKASRFSHWIGN